MTEHDPHHHGHHHDHGHGHSHRVDSGRLLILVLGLTLGFAMIEAVGGWWAGSLALLGDAGHMLTDSLALALAALAAWYARRPPSARHSYGYGRAEILAALVSALLMLAVVLGIATEAIQRLTAPIPADVKGGVVAWIAIIGLGVNLVAAWLLMGGRHNVNVRAALLHVMGDLLGSVAALAAGLVVLTTGWTPIDPLLSMLIALLILVSALRVVQDAVDSLLDGVPRGMDLEAIGRAMAGVEGAISVHDLHVWSISAETTALSAHVVLRRMDEWPLVLGRLHVLLRQEFAIDHLTLQPEAMETVVAFDPAARGPAPAPRPPA